MTILILFRAEGRIKFDVSGEFFDGSIFFISSNTSCGSSDSEVTISIHSLLCFIHCGPPNQMLPYNSDDVAPLERISAGFSFLGQWFHLCEGTRLLISNTCSVWTASIPMSLRVSNKVRLLSPSDIVLRKWSQTPKHFFDKSFDSISNYNLGIVCCTNGATLVFAGTNRR